MEEEDQFAGMTTNERLWSAGLMELWERAKAAEDRSEMSRLLRRVGFSKADAMATADLSIEVARKRRGGPRPR